MTNWPRSSVDAVACRKRDLVIRIANWLDDADEPAFDVELYIRGVYDWNESKTFALRQYKSPERARAAAIKFAQAQVNKHL